MINENEKPSLMIMVTDLNNTNKLMELMEIYQVITCLALPLAILGPRVGCIMNRRSPCRSVVHFPDCIFELQYCP